jgi:hypothetical protein
MAPDRHRSIENGMAADERISARVPSRPAPGTLDSFANSGCPRPSSISNDRPEEIAVTTSG